MRLLLGLLIYIHQYYTDMQEGFSWFFRKRRKRSPPVPLPPATCVIAQNNWLGATRDAMDGEVTSNFLPVPDGSLCPGCEPIYDATYTCGVPSGLDVKANVGSDANCERWKGHGYCEGKYANIMARDCATTCSTPEQESIAKSVISKDLVSVSFDCANENIVCRSGELELTDAGLLGFSIAGSLRWTQQHKPGVPTPEYAALMSKYKSNKLVAGQFLRVGEFVGSENGTCYLTVIKDGDKLKLVVARREYACRQEWDGEDAELSNTAWTEDAAALYEMELGPISTKYKGRVAYINSNNERELYNADHLQVAGSDKYQDVGQYSQSNVPSIAEKPSTSTDDCEIECNKMDECYGFVYDSDAKTCSLKGPEIFPKTLERIPMADARMFVRLKNVENSDTCSSTIAGVEAVDFNKLPAGRAMTSADQCRLALSTEAATEHLKSTQAPLTSALDAITGGIGALSGTGAELQKMSDRQVKRRTRATKEYVDVVKTAKKARAVQETVGGMETSTGYDMISNNYQFTVWATVAVLAVIGGIHASR